MVKRITCTLLYFLLCSLPLCGAADAQTPVTYTATWADQSTNEAGFKVYRINGPLASWTIACQTPANTKTCQIIEPDRSPRCYSVVAFNQGGDSVPSPMSCVALPASPGLPTVSEATAVVPSAVTEPRGTPASPRGFDGPMEER